MKCPHCDTPIDEHEASRCLDAWVAEAVMGMQKRIFEGQYPDSLWDDEAIFAMMETTGMTHSDSDGNAISPSHYSTDIAAAWEIVADYTSRQCHVLLDGKSGLGWSRWDCDIYTPTADLIGEGRDESRDLNIRVASAPLAICRAALKAAGDD